MRSGNIPLFSFVCVTCTPGACNSRLTHSAWPSCEAIRSGKVPLFSFVCVTCTPGALKRRLTHSAWPCSAAMSSGKAPYSSTTKVGAIASDASTADSGAAAPTEEKIARSCPALAWNCTAPEKRS
eukprot:1175255-Amphidinium_carterae.1